jgi:hypothetical protein
MTMASPLREPPALHDKAIQDLSFIRRTMEGASSFTDVPGWGLIAIGGTALGAAVLARLQPTPERWFWLWFAEAVLAATIGMTTMWRKMRRRGSARDGAALSVPARKFLLGLLPAIVAGAALSFALLDQAVVAGASPVPRHLPGLWLLLYGVGIVTAGAFSVRAVPLMGLVFMALGIVALFVRALPGDLALALGFGLVQVAFGTWIVRRHGG